MLEGNFFESSRESDDQPVPRPQAQGFPCAGPIHSNLQQPGTPEKRHGLPGFALAVSFVEAVDAPSFPLDLHRPALQQPPVFFPRNVGGQVAEGIGEENSA